MRAVVTGGAGFIGSHLVDALLERGDEVWVVDNLSSGRRERVPSRGELLEVDIRESLDEVLADARPEVVFHLAAQINVRFATAHPREDAEINILGTINVLEAARGQGAQVVFSSTGGAIYGEVEEAARESAPLDPISPYGVSKLACEEYLGAYNRLYGASHAALRYANVYGPRQDAHGEAGVVAIFLGALAAGKEPVIFGDGEQTRDFVYVGDVVRATLGAVGKGGVFNIGTGVETSVNELFGLCRRVAGTGTEAQREPARESELLRSFVDPSLAARELSWSPRVSLEEGLEQTWRSIRRRSRSSERA